MKEVRYFYVPDAASAGELPEEEAQHATRVLRMQPGDEMVLIDGKGVYHTAVVTEATKKRCLYRIKSSEPQERQWHPLLHIAMAPTKNMDRTEWFAEKATEIGVDEFTFLRCRWSERTVIKTDRIHKIVVAAVKQSHKAWMPAVNEMTDFKTFVEAVADRASASGRKVQRFICHCHDDVSTLQLKLPLRESIRPGEDVVVMVGPEGDFSVEEVEWAQDHGFQPVSLGKSRLRTETAALVAAYLMNLANQ